MTQQQYAKLQDQALEDIPKEFHASLSYKAYEQGHAYGYSDMYSVLTDLIEGFKSALKEYTNRILGTN